MGCVVILRLPILGCLSSISIQNWNLVCVVWCDTRPNCTKHVSLSNCFAVEIYTPLAYDHNATPYNIINTPWPKTPPFLTNKAKKKPDSYQKKNPDLPNVWTGTARLLMVWFGAPHVFGVQESGVCDQLLEPPRRALTVKKKNSVWYK